MIEYLYDTLPVSSSSRDATGGARATTGTSRAAFYLA
jgi:hypothetical protein